MALKIRLARGGAKKRPFYRIVVAEASSPRDGRYVERVGTYNPMVPKDHDQRLIINGERITFWLGKGAKPTQRVQKMLASAGLMAAPVLRDQPKKSAPGKKRAEREAEAAAAAAAAAEAAAAEAPVEEAAAEDAPVAEDAPAAEAPAEEEAAKDAPAAEAGEEKADS
ncbi:MAG: 30S ribosomal protein S16 [Candidatus Puniceispirillum sp.]